MISSKNITRSIFFLSLIGLLVSGFLSFEYSLPRSITCPLGGLSCEAVRNSQYSKMFGISVPILGILFYFSFSAISLLSLENTGKLMRKLIFMAATVGFLFSAYFTYLEAFVIHAFCFWCLTSALITLLIFLLSLLQYKTND